MRSLRNSSEYAMGAERVVILPASSLRRQRPVKRRGVTAASRQEWRTVTGQSPGVTDSHRPTHRGCGRGRWRKKKLDGVAPLETKRPCASSTPLWPQRIPFAWRGSRHMITHQKRRRSLIWAPAINNRVAWRQLCLFDALPTYLVHFLKARDLKG